MMRGLGTGVVALLLLGACGGAQRSTGTATGTATGTVVAPAPTPVEEAGAVASTILLIEHVAGVLNEVNAAEIAAARLALERAVSDPVRAYAQRMIDEHSSLDQQGKDLARFSGILARLPNDELLRIHRDEMTELRQLSGAAFDRAYLSQQIEAHQRTMILASASGRVSQNDQLNTFLSAVVQPTVRQHLVDAEAIRATLP